MTDSAAPTRVKILVVCLVVALVAFGVYLNALPNGLHVDDQQQIVDNEWIKSPRHLGEIFTSGVWDHAGRVSSYYRPLMYVIYMSTYLLFGLQPWAYHLVNVLLHVGASVLVFLVATTVLERYPDRLLNPLPVAAAAGLLFAVHPIHTEAVAWAAGVADLSYSFFYLLALYLYIRWGSRSPWALAAAATAFFLALLGKEPALTLPVLLLVSDWVLERETFQLRRTVIRLVPFLATAGVYLWLRVQALGGLAPVSTETSLGASFYLVNVLSLFARYLQALVLPIHLNFWHVFEPMTSLWSWAGMRSLLIIVAYLGAGLWAWRKSRLALLGWFLILLPLLPSFHISALNQGLENAFAERYLYLPSAGYVLFLAGSLTWLWVTRPAWRRPALVGVVAMTALFATATIRRNPVWKDAYTLWSDAVAKSPDSAVAQMNYGFALLSRGEEQKGKRHLQLARELDPGRVDLKIKNALAYAQKGRLNRAIFELNAAIALDPASAEANYNLAVLYERAGWKRLAGQHYLWTIEISPDHAQAHNNLGILYAEAAELEQAEEYFRKAVKIDPAHPDYVRNLARLRQLRSGTK